ncbi:RNA polymerase I-specific transcription initiation factor Rrn7 [Aspergillus taichungensis]|uniref:RNA polymerase I-specific transcription initiation factor Rrn7 n=1 Tax=Aspergillus taichungensis TaxID=482145 RepID=A0A2J5I3N5_9EURO|nr:RNA polymerase I-specific transcription initiation factor Rrn7 [Aspergillus taichungensis]
MEARSRGVCGQEGCRETRYFIENGLWYCRRGHQQEGMQIGEDADDFGTQGKVTRLKKPVREKPPKTYKGKHAYLLFLHIYQLILWKQCHALVQGRGFPAKLENIVRDLWALRLETLSDKINTFSEKDEPEFFSSSQPAAATEAEKHTEAPKIGSKYLQWPRLIDSIALCYLAALLMRIPISIADFHRMLMRGEVPFLRIILAIPREMRDRLPQEYLSLLETTRLPKAEHLHKAALDLSVWYRHQFGMEFPGLNLPPLLYRYIKRLAVPIEIYTGVHRLNTITRFPFAFPERVTGRVTALHLPEVQLATLIVISTKLFFPFDDIKRYPQSTREPSSQVVNWELWAQVQRHFDARETSGGRIGKGKEVLVNDNDVFNMSPAQLDEYMDWYENSWLDVSRGNSNFLADLFPLGRFRGKSRPPSQAEPADTHEDEEEAIESMIQTVSSQLKPRRAIRAPDSDILRPGAEYQRYRLDSDLSDEAEPFYETVAKVTGISLSTLVRVVHQTESKISRWVDDQRRESNFMESSDAWLEGDDPADDQSLPELEDES